MLKQARKILATNLINVYPEGSERKKLELKFKDIIYEELNLNSLVSYVGNKKFPILRIYRYKEAFSFGFVEEIFKRFNVNSGDYIFDPFVGLGTTTFASMIYGFQSIGIDKLPLAYFISKTIPKFLFLERNELKEIWELIKTNVKNKLPAYVAMDVPIMRVAFNEENLLSLRKLKTAIEELEQPYKDIFLLLFFSILEECSFTSKDGQFLRIKRDKKVLDPIYAMNRKVIQVEEDICYIKKLFPNLTVNDNIIPDIHLADARDLSNIHFRKKPTVIITSPPYVNRYDYTRTYCLELCFHFVRNFEELKAIRFGILRSHIESKIRKDETPPHPAIKEVVDILSKKKLNNPKIPYMLTAYFVDMKKVISEWYKILAPGAKVFMVIDNVRFEGEMIPVDIILSDMAEEIGFRIKKIIVARYKGNSSQQMKKYGKIPVRESIVIWEK